MIVDEEELKQFEQHQLTMNSRMTRDYWANENNRDFKALNDENDERNSFINDDRNFSINDVRNFLTNAHAFAVAELISSSRFQKFRKFKELTYQATKQNNLKEFEHD